MDKISKKLIFIDFCSLKKSAVVAPHKMLNRWRRRRRDRKTFDWDLAIWYVLKCCCRIEDWVSSYEYGLWMSRKRLLESAIEEWFWVILFNSKWRYSGQLKNIQWFYCVFFFIFLIFMKNSWVFTTISATMQKRKEKRRIFVNNKPISVKMISNDCANGKNFDTNGRLWVLSIQKT